MKTSHALIAASVLLLQAGLVSCAQKPLTLKETAGKTFVIGCAVNADIVADKDCKAHQLIVNQYNQIVAENCMKPEEVQPAEGDWHFDDADRLVAFGEENGMRIIGHCLVWHSQTPDWFFRDENGKPASRELMLERMRTHIFTVMGRYRGRIYGWDVVNEAWLDDGTMRPSLWRQLVGEDFIEQAFRFAHEADPDAELYYNDYSMSNPTKNQAVCRMVRDFRAKGIRIDAVGMQSHNGLTWPDMQDYENAIDSLAACGVKVNITELDLNVLPAPEGFGGADVNQHFDMAAGMDPFADGIDDEHRLMVEDRWMEHFRIYQKHAAQIDRVTLWGVGDADSWLNDFPIPGRHCYGLLFDGNYDAKPVLDKILKLYE